MDINKLKEQINNKLGDEMRKVEMDVTNSFMSGKICSPLISYGGSMLRDINSVKNNTLSTLSTAGIYITKDGLQVDPSAVINLGSSILNTAIETVKTELLSIRNYAWKRLTYIPDPSIITKKALSYFSFYLEGGLDINSLLNDISVDEQFEKENEEKKKNFSYYVTYFVEQKLPVAAEKVSYYENIISQYCAYASYYAAFGPEWLTDTIVDGIESGSDAVIEEIAKLMVIVDDFKLELYDKAGEEIGKFISKLYESLLRDNLKDVNDEVEKNKSLVKIKARALIQQANLKIMAKTGVHIPVEKISKENYNKIKRNAKLAKLLNLAGLAGGGGDEDTNGKPADDTTNVPNGNVVPLNAKNSLPANQQENWEEIQKAGYYVDKDTGKDVFWNNGTGMWEDNISVETEHPAYEENGIIMTWDDTVGYYTPAYAPNEATVTSYVQMSQLEQNEDGTNYSLTPEVAATSYVSGSGEFIYYNPITKKWDAIKLPALSTISNSFISKNPIEIS